MEYKGFEIRREDRKAAASSIDFVTVAVFLIFCGGSYVHYAHSLAGAKEIVDNVIAGYDTVGL